MTYCCTQLTVMHSCFMDVHVASTASFQRAWASCLRVPLHSVIGFSSQCHALTFQTSAHHLQQQQLGMRVFFWFHLHTYITLITLITLHYITYTYIHYFLSIDIQSWYIPTKAFKLGLSVNSWVSGKTQSIVVTCCHYWQSKHWSTSKWIAQKTRWTIVGYQYHQ